MATNSKEVALRKRQQIDSSKKAMFIAVAIAAFISGIALVVSFFLVQQIIFHGKIISAKQSTLSTIEKNIETVDDLKDNIRALDANQALNSVKISGESSALQSILDALPAEPNADALGASLQIRFVGEAGGVTINSLSVDNADAESLPIGGQAEPAPVGSSAASSGTAASDSSSANSSENEGAESPSIGFNMTVTGSVEGLKELLSRFEKSIRVIDLTSITIQANSTDLQMTLVGRAYYEPGRVIKLGEKVIMP